MRPPVVISRFPLNYRAGGHRSVDLIDTSSGAALAAAERIEEGKERATHEDAQLYLKRRTESSGRADGESRGRVRKARTARSDNSDKLTREIVCLRSEKQLHWRGKREEEMETDCLGDPQVRHGGGCSLVMPKISVKPEQNQYSMYYNK